MFDVGSAGYKMNEFKQELYDKSGIGIPHEDVETNDVAIFGWDIFSLLLLMYVYYTCHIAVGIPKTAIGVTAILPTAIAVTAMTAKNSVFFRYFWTLFMTIRWFLFGERLFS